MRFRTFALLLVLAGATGPATADVSVGDVRETQSKTGTPMREEPKALAKVVDTLAYRTRVTVTEVGGLYAKVATDAGKSGWVRALDLVLPGTLTGPGAYDGARTTSSSDISAAGRQFDESIEQQYRATRAELEAAYKTLDDLMAKSLLPTSPEIEAFVVEGRLGR